MILKHPGDPLPGGRGHQFGRKREGDEPVDRVGTRLRGEGQTRDSE